MPPGPVRRRLACCWSCSWRLSSPLDRWSLASMRRWNVAGGRRSLQRESTEIPCSRPASASSRPAASDESAWCFWRRSLGLLGFGLCRFSQRWPTQNVTPKSRASGTRRDNRMGAWQLLLLVRRWYPQREIVAVAVAVADRAYASLKLLDRCQNLRKPITFITRLRLDAALYEPAPPRRPGQMGRDLASKVRGCRISR